MATVATLSASEQWVPQSENETQVKAAMQTVLVTSPSSVITKAPDNQTNRFILQTQGYFGKATFLDSALHNIYQYVVMGMNYTRSKEEFEKNFIKSAFKAVDQIDSGAYTLLRDTTVSVSIHCDEFNTNGLGRLTTSANGAIAFADQCIGLMKEKTDISLYNNFLTLLDEKYRTGPKDDTFEEAKENAKMVVTNLAKVSKAKGQDATEMVGLLQAFYTKTDIDSKNVQRINENFLTGPIDPNTGKRKLKSNGQNQEPYGDVMDAEIVRLQDDIMAQTKIRDVEDDKWRTARDKAITLGVIGAFVMWFYIGMGIEADKAKKAKQAYKDAIDQIIKDNEDKANIVKVLELVRALVNNYNQLLPKMFKAMNAMQEVEALFKAQNLNFQIIDNKFEDLLTGVDAKTWAGRRNWILTAIDEAVERFREIKALGEEFNRSAIPTIVKF
ncbi:hypothetical protein JMJ35_007053 [Cladonia borealis]|uniref:Uncharacterized protein n=1 Tax=Cladonia borealis TaxID=184061 RepID=A0AA39QZF1_9LECA|nr:hypothetical protein JMJ35_007053 [Cladonia borealis]